MNDKIDFNQKSKIKEKKSVLNKKAACIHTTTKEHITSSFYSKQQNCICRLSQLFYTQFNSSKTEPSSSHKAFGTKMH